MPVFESNSERLIQLRHGELMPYNGEELGQAIQGWCDEFTGLLRGSGAVDRSSTEHLKAKYKMLFQLYYNGGVSKPLRTAILDLLSIGIYKGVVSRDERTPFYGPTTIKDMWDCLQHAMEIVERLDPAYQDKRDAKIFEAQKYWTRSQTIIPSGNEQEFFFHGNMVNEDSNDAKEERRRKRIDKLINLSEPPLELGYVVSAELEGGQVLHYTRLPGGDWRGIESFVIVTDRWLKDHNFKVASIPVELLE